MSYILQALKKSEQERQRGSIPNLQSSQIIVEHPEKQRSIWLRFFVIALVLNVAAMVYWFQPWKKTPGTQSASTTHKQPVPLTATPSAPEQQQVVPSSSEATMTVKKPVTEPLPTAAKTASKGTDTSPITPAAVPESPAQKQQWQKITPSTPQNANAVKQDIPHPETIALANPATLRQENPVGVTHPESKGVANAETQWQKISPSSSQKAIATEQVPAIPASQPTKKDSTEPKLQSVHELPVNIQQSLPGIAVAAHIYSSDPASRMTIINNKSLREGQVIGAGLVLEEITRDGVILKFQGQRFHLGKLQSWKK